MSTYADIAARGHGTPVYWLEISGIPKMCSDGFITNANLATLFNDGYTEDFDVVPVLAPLSISHSRSIDIFEPEGRTGGLEVEIVDAASTTYPDGFGTWLFGHQRSTIGSARLAEDITRIEDAWTLDGTQNTMPVTAMGSRALAYCQLETVEYGTHYTFLPNDDPPPVGWWISWPDEWTSVTRSMYLSPSMAHNQDREGRYQRVTDHPTQWAGRIVTLFQTFRDGDGLASTDGTSATTRAEARIVRGILRDLSYEEGRWRLRCDGIDSLLNRKVLKGQRTLSVSRFITVPTGTLEDKVATGVVCEVELYDPTPAVPQLHYAVAVTPGTYSPDDFISAVNAALDPAVLTDFTGTAPPTFLGNLAFALEEDNLRVSYRSSEVAADVRVCRIHWAISVPQMLGYSYNTSMIWRQVGLDLSDYDNTRLNEAYGTDVNDEAALGRTGSYTVDLHKFADAHLRWDTVPPGDTTVTAATLGIAVDDTVAMVSEDGVTFCAVMDLDFAKREIRLGRLYPPRGVLHTGTPDTPIQLRKCFWSAGMEAFYLQWSTLALMLSTGESPGLWNHARYDVLPQGVGVEIPCTSPTAFVDETASLIDVTSFEAFFAEAACYCGGVLDACIEPTPVKEIVVNRLAFLGGYLTVRNGKLTAVRGIQPLWCRNDALVTEKNLLAARSLKAGNVTSLDSVEYKWEWSWSKDKFMTTYTFLRGDSQSDQDTHGVSREDKGIVATAQMVSALATDHLREFDEDCWVYSLEVDRSCAMIEPGMIIKLSDEGADEATAGQEHRLYRGLPSPNGTRGHSRTPLLVLEAATDYGTGITSISALQSNHKRSGYSATAWIASFDAGRTVLTCVENFFRPDADGHDVAAFAAGDKVRVNRINPPFGGAAVPNIDETGFTVASVNAVANTITLTGAISALWVSGTTPMVLQHDPYTTASQTTTAKEWCWVGDSSGDLGDGGDDCYEW